MILLLFVLAACQHYFTFSIFPLQSLLDLMIEEEKALKKQLLNNIEKCRKELAILCKELQRPPLKVQ